MRGVTDPAQPNPYGAITPSGPAAAALATYSYSRDSTENDTVDSNESFGVRLSARAVQLLDGGGGWQQATDPSTVQITRLAITPATRTVPLGHLCAPACSEALANCPRLDLRSLELTIEGRSPVDASVIREVRESVRVRNDDVSSPACP
jgi:prepilin peptidase dependent protein B